MSKKWFWLAFIIIVGAGVASADDQQKLAVAEKNTKADQAGAATEIAGSRFIVSADALKSVFSITEKSSGLRFATDTPLVEPAESVQVVAIPDSVWGSGQGLEIKYKSGDSGRFMLFDQLPYVLYQGSLVNQSGEMRVVKKYTPFELAFKLQGDSDKLQMISTAGLLPITSGRGGYMFLAVADPQSRNGLVCGWLTTDKGSGIVVANEFKGDAKLLPHVDYGDLRVPANSVVKSEIVAIGYFDDVRLGLEQYADAVAKYYDIRLRPQPDVYCTWYHAKASDEERILKNAQFARSELLPHGLSVMQIDDRWQGDSSKIKIDGTKYNGPYKVFTQVGTDGIYKSGMAHTAANLKKEGFTPGLWFMPFAGTYNDPYFADKQDLFFKNPETGAPYDMFWGGTEIDMSNPKSQQYLRENIKRYVDWGYKYFKMDGLFTGLGVRIRYPSSRYIDDNLGELVRFNHDITSVESYRNAFKIIRETAGDDVFFLGCNVAQNMRVLGASFGMVDAMRVGPDNGTQWDHWKTEGKLVGTLKVGPVYSGRVYFLHGRVWYNDPDPLYVREPIPLEQVKAIASWVALSGNLNSTSEDYYDLPAERLDVLKRTLPAHTSKNVRPVDYLENEPAQIWLLSEKIGTADHHVAGLYNWDSSKSMNVDYSLERMGLESDGEYCGFDFWANKFVGPFRGQLKYEVAAATCSMLALRKVTPYPQVISTSRHVTQGVVDLVTEQWKGSTLSGTSRVIANDPYEIRVVAPASFNVKTAQVVGAPSGTTIKFEQQGTEVRATIQSAKTAEISWTLSF